MIYGHSHEFRHSHACWRRRSQGNRRLASNGERALGAPTAWEVQSFMDEDEDPMITALNTSASKCWDKAHETDGQAPADCLSTKPEALQLHLVVRCSSWISAKIPKPQQQIGQDPLHRTAIRFGSFAP